MTEKIGKYLSTIARALKKLQTQGQLRQGGTNKSGHWELIDESFGMCPYTTLDN